ncbi:MAG TPA: transcriptional regulator [Herpetosiphon sp.]|uniref:Transcriptional regulator, ArsR family n=2 Tax=Herpetosiphon TaxID=64 RepID=A9B5K9_HERA2|nr:transcriptional regulator [Herpetosiphon sp.]ABX04242.1 transcriptional regulator, ArsR family [Herpetosiphon aurantiacus DSM 785]MCA0350662.1 transcriptional regulator [Chloroflexota bacterium]HBW52639.1 transcriptional regulator [Herpetosiphon sp.]
MDKHIKTIAQLNRLVHEPVRLQVMSYLATVDEADFLYLMNELELTQGNLGSHMSKLEAEGYISVTKEFVARRPRTSYRLTSDGKVAIKQYWRLMRSIASDVND